MPAPESATVRVFTAARMQEIEDNCVVSAYIEVGEDSARNLILVKNNGVQINVGNVGGTGSVVVDPGTGGTQAGVVTNTVQEVV